MSTIDPTVEFLDPFNDRRLLAYYEQIYYWHGFIRFLGLPHLQDNPDVPIERLYVPPELSERRIAPEEVEGTADARKPLLETLAENPRLVLLGDPGSGKSTLVSWISYQLTRSTKNRFVQALGPLVPLPLVLRELPLDEDITWDRLIDAFLNRPMAEVLDRKMLDELLARGQAFVMLDGLDEISGLQVRKALKRAVMEGLHKYPENHWLATSRVVGYDEAPFHLRTAVTLPPESMRALTKNIDTFAALSKKMRVFTVEDWAEIPEDSDTRLMLRRLIEGKGPDDLSSWADVFHVAPFSNEQIERFAHCWHARYQGPADEAETKARDLIDAIHGSTSTRTLGRIPNLLTLMALIHRIKARLPHGRAILYSKIAEAYLESIDTFYGLSDHGPGYSLEEKKRWLGRVGFEMQKRRTARETEGQRKPFEPEREAREILVEEQQLLRWLTTAMEESPSLAASEDEPQQQAKAFVDYIARRSGLLLPRGEGVFAFTHLSFQEYFAAEYLYEQITGPDWRSDSRTTKGDGPEDLRRYAGQTDWHETLLLLFGLFAGRPRWSVALLNLLFGRELDLLSEASLNLFSEASEAALFTSARARLLASLTIDPYSGLPGDKRQDAARECWRLDLREPAAPSLSLARILLSSPDETERSRQLDVLIEVAKEHSATSLRLHGCSTLRDITFLSSLKNLELVDLSGTVVRNIGPLRELHKLQRLDLDYTQVEDIEPLKGLRELIFLTLNDTQVHHTEPLRELRSLNYLDLSHTPVQDIEPLKKLHNLGHLDLSHTPFQDIEPLKELHNLWRLDLDHKQFQDIELLRELRNLQYLSLGNTQVQNVEPLRELHNLRLLDLAHTQVQNIEPLKSLPNIQFINLQGTPIEIDALEWLKRKLPNTDIQF